MAGHRMQSQNNKYWVKPLLLFVIVFTFRKLGPPPSVIGGGVTSSKALWPAKGETSLPSYKPKPTQVTTQFESSFTSKPEEWIDSKYYGGRFNWDQNKGALLTPDGKSTITRPMSAISTKFSPFSTRNGIIVIQYSFIILNHFDKMTLLPLIQLYSCNLNPETYHQGLAPLIRFGPVLPNPRQGRIYAKLSNSNFDYVYSDEIEILDGLEYVTTLVLKSIESSNFELSVFLSGKLVIRKTPVKMDRTGKICGLGFVHDSRAGRVQLDNVLLTSDEPFAKAMMTHIVDKEKLKIHDRKLKTQRAREEQEKQAQRAREEQEKKAKLVTSKPTTRVLAPYRLPEIFFEDDFSSGLSKWTQTARHSFVEKFSWNAETKDVSTPNKKKYFGAISAKFPSLSTTDVPLMILQYSCKFNSRPLRLYYPRIRLYDCSLEPLNLDCYTPSLLTFGTLNNSKIFFQYHNAPKHEFSYEFQLGTKYYLSLIIGQDIRLLVNGTQVGIVSSQPTPMTQVCGIGFPLWDSGYIHLDDVLLTDSKELAKQRSGLITT